MIQHERAANFDFHTGRDQAPRGDAVLLHGADAEDADGARDGAAGEGAEGGAGGGLLAGNLYVHVIIVYGQMSSHRSP